MAKERERQVKTEPLLTPEQLTAQSFFTEGLRAGEPGFEGPFAAPLDPLEATGIGLAERFAGTQAPAISGLAGEALTGLLTGEGRGIEMIGRLFDVSRQLTARKDVETTEGIRTAAVAQGAGGSGQLLETLRRFGEERALQQEQTELGALSNLFVQAIGGAQTQGQIEDREALTRSGAATAAGGLRRGVADLPILRELEQFNQIQNRELQRLGLAGSFGTTAVPFGQKDFTVFEPTAGAGIAGGLFDLGGSFLSNPSTKIPGFGGGGGKESEVPLGSPEASFALPGFSSG